MKVFKQLVRSVVLVSFVGGWALAASAVHVVRTPSSKIPTLLTKDHMGFHDTYVDTRNWTFTDDKAHPELVARVLELGRTDLLAHTVNSSLGPVNVQLAAAVQNPTTASANEPDLTTKVKDGVKNGVDLVKSKIN